jgi:propanol-preferring alcohol dehydrogenase
MVSSMRVMQVSQPSAVDACPLELVQRPALRAGPGELLVRIAACGVCRTDLQICEGDLAAQRLPIVPGHQAVGRVEEVASGTTGWQVGDRAGIAWLAGACGTCGRCRGGQENLCDSATFTGWHRDGGFATHALVREDFALRIPTEFDDVAAAPLLCGGVIGFRALRVSGVEPGQRLGLFGFGASALLALQVARHWGCRVFVSTRSKIEQKTALDLGAEWAGTYEERVPARLDAAITFAPTGSVAVRALEALDRGATLVINAIHLDEMPAFSYEHLWWERTIRSVANFTRADARDFLELAAAVPIRTSVQLYGLQDANRALQDLKAGHVRGAAVLQMP